MVANEWRCRKASKLDVAVALESSEDLGIRCDDGLDCPDGETCCTLFGYGQRTCVARGDVLSVCQAEICMEGGARCPSGRTCTAKGNTEGRCVAGEPQATCTGKRRCSKDKPVCAIIQGAATCVAKGSAEYESVRGSARYQCTRQEDCNAGDTCYYSYGDVEHEASTFCGSYSRAHMGSLVCDTTAPSRCKKGDKECEELNQCRADESLKSTLPWLGAL